MRERGAQQEQQRERDAQQSEDDDDVEEFLERIRSELARDDGGGDVEKRKEQWETQQRKMRKIDTEERPDLAGEIHRVANPRNAGDEKWELTPPFMRPVDRREQPERSSAVRRPQTELPKLAKRLGGGIREDKTNLYPIPVKYINNFPCYSRRQLNDLNHLLQKNILSPWLSSEITPVLKDGNVVGFLGGPPWHIWEDLIKSSIYAIKSSNVETAVIRKDFNIPDDVLDVAGYLGKLRDTAGGGLTRFYIEREYTRSNIPLKVREGVAKKKIVLEAPLEVNIQIRRWKESVWEWSYPSAQWKSAVKEALEELQSILLITKLNSKAFLQKRDELTVRLEGIRNRLQPIEETLIVPPRAKGDNIRRLAPHTASPYATEGTLRVDTEVQATNKVIEWNGILHSKRINDLIKENVTITPNAKELIRTNYFNYKKNILTVEDNSLRSVPTPFEVHIAPILKNMGSYDFVISNQSKVTITASDVVEYLGDSHFQFCDYKYGTYEKPDGSVMYLGDNCTYSQAPTPKYIFEGSYYMVGPDLHSDGVSTRGARRLALLLGVDISQIPPCFSVPPGARLASTLRLAPILKEDVMLYFKRDGRNFDKEDGARDDKYRKALRSVLKKSVVRREAPRQPEVVVDPSISKPILSHLVKEMNAYKTDEQRKLYIETITVPAYFNNQKHAQLETIINKFNEEFKAHGLTFNNFINLNRVEAALPLRSTPSGVEARECNPKSPKAKNPLYKCNPATGRWILR